MPFFGISIRLWGGKISNPDWVQCFWKSGTSENPRYKQRPNDAKFPDDCVVAAKDADEHPGGAQKEPSDDVTKNNWTSRSLSSANISENSLEKSFLIHKLPINIYFVPNPHPTNFSASRTRGAHSPGGETWPVSRENLTPLVMLCRLSSADVPRKPVRFNHLQTHSGFYLFSCMESPSSLIWMVTIKPFFSVLFYYLG